MAFEILSYKSYLMSPMTNWAAHAGRVHPAIPGDPEPRLMIPKAQGLWSETPHKNAAGKDGIDLQCPMCSK